MSESADETAMDAGAGSFAPLSAFEHPMDTPTWCEYMAFRKWCVEQARGARSVAEEAEAIYQWVTGPCAITAPKLPKGWTQYAGRSA